MSPAMVAAAAVRGQVADVRELLATAPADPAAAPLAAGRP